MISTWTSAALETPADSESYVRADLAFYDVDHSGSSYEARIYLDDPDVSVETGYDHPGYAGAYHVFGHGGCFGDEGHCLVPTNPPDPLDPRGPHQLTPQTKNVIITAALKRRPTGRDAEPLTVTVVAITVDGKSNDVLQFSQVRLITYA